MNISKIFYSLLVVTSLYATPAFAMQQPEGKAKADASTTACYKEPVARTVSWLKNDTITEFYTKNPKATAVIATGVVLVTGYGIYRVGKCVYNAYYPQEEQVEAEEMDAE